jgi:hypothetical protein
MVDAMERLLPAGRQAAGQPGADQQAPDEPGPPRHAQLCDLGGLDASAVKGGAEQARQAFEMGTRGDLGNHPAEIRMQLLLRGDQVDQDLAAAADESDRRFVATGLDAERQGVSGIAYDARGGSRRKPATSGSILFRFSSNARLKRGE